MPPLDGIFPTGSDYLGISINCGVNRATCSKQKALTQTGSASEVTQRGLATLALLLPSFLYLSPLLRLSTSNYGVNSFKSSRISSPQLTISYDRIVRQSPQYEGFEKILEELGWIDAGSWSASFAKMSTFLCDLTLVRSSVRKNGCPYDPGPQPLYYTPLTSTPTHLLAGSVCGRTPHIASSPMPVRSVNLPCPSPVQKRNQGEKVQWDIIRNIALIKLFFSFCLSSFFLSFKAMHVE